MGIIKLAVTIGASIGALFIRPQVELAEDSVEIGRPLNDVREDMRERFGSSPDDILAAESNRMVRRFSGSEGKFSYETVEVVRFEEDAITFEHIAGPFAECNERFQLTEILGGTRLTHTGYFRLRGGLWMAPLSIGPVKKAFENHVNSHFQTMAKTHPMSTE